LLRFPFLSRPIWAHFVCSVCALFIALTATIVFDRDHLSISLWLAAGEADRFLHATSCDGPAPLLAWREKTGGGEVDRTTLAALHHYVHKDIGFERRHWHDIGYWRMALG